MRKSIRSPARVSFLPFLCGLSALSLLHFLARSGRRFQEAVKELVALLLLFLGEFCLQLVLRGCHDIS